MFTIRSITFIKKYIYIGLHAQKHHQNIPTQNDRWIIKSIIVVDLALYHLAMAFGEKFVHNSQFFPGYFRSTPESSWNRLLDLIEYTFCLLSFRKESAKWMLYVTACITPRLLFILDAHRSWLSWLCFHTVYARQINV